MDLIYTNANRADQGILKTHAFDLSYGSAENDYELTLGADEPVLEYGAILYIEGTEYGGVVDAVKTSTNGDTITYKGRTWHGILNSKVIEPNTGESHLVVSGDANEILQSLIARLGLSDLFVAIENLSGVNIPEYKFNRYCKGYDGIRAMLAKNGAKLKIAWKGRCVYLSAEPITDYTDSPLDGDTATLTVEHHENKVNHLICLGRGELVEREIIHLYVDQFGRIGSVQYYTGLDEFTGTYENVNSENLRADGIAKLTELNGTDKAEFAVAEGEGLSYDIGDIVGALEIKTGVKVAETVTQKIIKIKNGVVSTEYKTSEETATNSGSASDGDNTESDETSELPIATITSLGAIKVGDNLNITEDGTLSVTTASQVEQDNTLPITSAAVHTTVGNIEVLLATI